MNMQIQERLAATPYDMLGGDDAVHALVNTFYDRMDTSPAYADIRRLHGSDLAPAREKLYLFLSGWLGGPGLYVEKYGHPMLRARHLPFPIGTRERDQWLSCMHEAMDALDVQGTLRGHLNGAFLKTADWMRNRPG